MISYLIYISSEKELVQKGQGATGLGVFPPYLVKLIISLAINYLIMIY